MSWNHQPMDVNQNHSAPYNSIGSFVDFFGSFTYEHVNYIFADANYVQGDGYDAYPMTNMSLYKFAVSEPGSFSYYETGNGFVPVNVNYSGYLENVSGVVDDVSNVDSGSPLPARATECPRTHQDARGYEILPDYIDPDNMTYEELLELGEVVGKQSRGLSQDQIASLPKSKFKCGFFSRKKSKRDRCVICQLEYKRGDKQITLPCKHVYHTNCGSRWLSINKACPICYKEVVFDVSKQ